MAKILIVLGAIVLLVGGGTYYFLQAGNTAPGASETQNIDLYGLNSTSTEVQDQNVVTPGQASFSAAISTNPSSTTGQGKKNMQATLKTNKGEVVIEFMVSDAPKTVENFTKLAGQGFYNGTKFHRVISGFMIQGGDPLSKDDSMSSRWGTGGPGYTFEDEIHANNKNNIGTISMANAGPDTNGSQFFINTANNNFLDGKHAVFGKVISGMEIVKAIETTQTGQNDRPVAPIVIESVTLK